MKRFALIMVAAALADPFAFLAPTAVLTDKEQLRLADGKAVVRTVRGRSRDVTLVAAVKVETDGLRLTSWYRNIERLRQSPFVPEVGRFSDPPRIEDLDRLTLEQVDADELRNCRPENCGLKLSPAEVRELKTTFGEPLPLQAARLQAAFRRVVLARAREYLRAGRTSGPPPPVYLSAHWPQLTTGILQFPRVAMPDTESFLYWSKEKLSGKPIVSATHVTIARTSGMPSPVVISRQIFATHYVDGAWAATTIAHDQKGVKYLVYVNQSEVDLLRGFFGGLVRSTIERQLRGEAEDLIQGIRRRLESGEPPSTPRN